MFSSIKNAIVSLLISVGLISAPLSIPITPPQEIINDYQNKIDVLYQRVSELQTQLDGVLGATTQQSETVAFFETALQASISSSATSFTLLAITDKAGTNLASSTYAFVIDEGEASEEIVIADCFVSGAKTCNNAVRGVSTITGTSSVTALQKAHRRGASVKITDAPALLYLNNIFKGKQFIEKPITYDFSSTTLTAGSEQLASVSYVDGVALAGCGTATESSSGCSQLASKIAQASSTPTARALNSSNSTSTPGANITASGGVGETYAVISEDDGKINQNWLDLTENFTFSSSTSNRFQSTNASTTNLAVLSQNVHINGVDYNLPSTQGASSTAPLNDGSGNITWNNPSDLIELANETLASASSSWSVPVPDRNFYKMTFYLEANGNPGTATLAPNVATPANIDIFSIYNATNTTEQIKDDECLINNGGGGNELWLSGNVEINAASSTQIFYDMRVSSYSPTGTFELFEAHCTGPNPGIQQWVFDAPGAGDWATNSRITIYGSRD